jgi:Protein of unknown function (DUF3343).
MIINGVNEYMLVFASHNQAVFLYNRLIKLGLKVELISTPCRLSAGCTQSLKFNEDLLTVVRSEAIKSNMMIRGIYKIVRENNKTNYIPI